MHARIINLARLRCGLRADGEGADLVEMTIIATLLGCFADFCQGVMCVYQCFPSFSMLYKYVNAIVPPMHVAVGLYDSIVSLFHHDNKLSVPIQDN